MADAPWLQPGDQILIDGADFRVVELLVARTDRMTFQCAIAAPQLGGEQRTLLQLEGGLLEAHPLDPEMLSGEQVKLEDRSFALRWDSEVRTERMAEGKSVKFGRGQCAWYVADDGSVALLVVERHDRDACVGSPLAPSRIDLRFTEGLRKGRG